MVRRKPCPCSSRRSRNIWLRNQMPRLQRRKAF